MIQDGVQAQQFQMDSVLMIGQSNMAGRGDMADVAPIRNPMCYMLRNGRWQPMREPINPDRPIFEGRYRSGVSLGASFADSYAGYFSRNVGMIPCADGGTTVSQWQPGELLYDHAVMQTKLAKRTSDLKAILWHQGESDCSSVEDLQNYGARFLNLMQALRREVGDVPVIIGQIHPGITAYLPKAQVERMNAVFRELPHQLPRCALVRTTDLTLKPDNLHFDAASCRELGKRYFEAYLCLL
jgi:hypothetical protein